MDYKETIQQMIADGVLSREDAKKYVSELVESEDERIRKEIVSALKYANFKGVYDKHIAWLEKQGERKPYTDMSLVEAVRYCVTDTLTNDSTDDNGNTARFGIYIDDAMAKKLAQNLSELFQKPAEWSEADEEMLSTIVSDGLRCVGLDEHQVSWLQSLSPQSHWKPSQEQMKVLNEVISFAADHGTMRWNDYIYNVLKTLREELKKL